VFQWKSIVSRLAAASAAASLALPGCERRAEAPSPPPPVAAQPSAPAAPAPPLPPPPLGRGELLAALDAARSAYAAGEPDPEESLAARRFSIREAFGCAGARAATDEPGVASATWDPKAKSVDISLVPADVSGLLIVGEDAARWEAAEGYWITHPWLRSGDCPAARPSEAAPQVAEAPSAPPRRTDGLAAVFEREGSRVGRRSGKPFSLTLRDEAAPPPPAGYRLVLEGRLAAFASGRAVRCQAHGADERPVCLAAAVVDRVAIESADGKLLKEWRLG
jgi:hypothetical protein